MKGRIYPNRGGYVVRFGRDISKWFKHREAAERFLTGLRYETDKGSFDARDYRSDRPLAFETLAEKYLAHKQQTVKPRSYNNLANYMGRAVTSWGGMNVKTIGYAEIEDFLFAQRVSDKTKANMKSCLHDFWQWLRRRKVLALAQMPEFPSIKFELGWRQTVDGETQQAIISEVKRISYHKNPRIWLGIRWLSVYISIRPAEMINIQEKHIDLDAGVVFIPHPKEGTPKVVPLLDDDVQMLREIPRGLPELYFFRHLEGGSGVKPGSKFGPRYLYKWWKKACSNLGIEGVDLYGGTRHSTATALGQVMSPEQIRMGTMHSTNKAFERYFQRQVGDARNVYQAAQRLQQTYNQKGEGEKGKVLKIK